MYSMLKFVSNRAVFNPLHLIKKLQTLSPIVSYHIYCHFSSIPLSNLAPNVPQTNVAIFWDLNNKPPKSISIFDTAFRIKKASLTFGVVRYMAAFGNRNWLNSVRLEGNVVKENVGSVKAEPSFCGVCGRRFYNSERLVNHFKQVHEVEQRKRVSQIESASGSRRVKLVGKFLMKLRKYRTAVREVLNPHVGNGLADDLKREGFWVKAVADKRDVAGDELGKFVLNVVDMREVGCVVIVSDDPEFVSVSKEAKVRGVKTVVVGDRQDGELKRISDAAFSWQEIILGKAKKEAVSVVGRWKDHMMF